MATGKAEASLFEVPGSDALSPRGRVALTPPPPYLLRAFAAREDLYNAATNPSGFVDMSVAENRLAIPLVADAMSKVPPIPIEWLIYDDMHGSKRFRTALASMLSTHLVHRPIGADDIAVVAGAGAVVDLFTTCVCEQGDRVIITTPAYRMLENDVGARAGCECVTAKLSASNYFKVTADALDAAWLDAGGEESRIKMCILCSPNNPTGEVLSKDVILDCVAWARKRRVHLLMDEIYGMSVFGRPDSGFTSVAEVVPDLGEFVHIAWSMSKDLCISGARVGVLISKNSALLQSFAALGYFCSTSRHTQWALTNVLESDGWMDNYLVENRRRLEEAYRACTSSLEKLQIPYRESQAGFFLCINLRRWMADDSEKSEDELWEALCDDAKVLITQGKQMLSSELGWFRVCFAAVDPGAMDVAWERVGKVLRAIDP